MTPALLLLAMLSLQDPAVGPPAPPGQPAPAPQPAAASAPARTEGGWRELDRVVMVVNQDIITSSRLSLSLAQLMRTRKLSSDTERRAAEMQILGERVRERLAVQAGANLGIDEKLIERRVQENLDRLRERENGTVGLARFLQSRDVSAQEAPRLLKEDIYSQIWHDGVTGEGPGALGRVVADRYVRPGALPMFYRMALERPADLEAIGGSVARVKFQQIVLDVAQSGGEEPARALAAALKARVEAGEDMGSLARNYGTAREGDGVSEAEQARLRELFPEIEAFTSKAAAGQVSDPIASSLRGKPLLRVVRLLERTEARVPDLTDATVQEKLRKRALERLDQSRLEQAYAGLLRSSYVWPPELAGR
jgi:hypothetical protein